MGLNVLLISLDSTLAVDEDNVAGDAKGRHIEYAKHLENLYIVVKTSKIIKRKVKKFKDNLFIYPTSSLNRYLFLYNTYNLASKICKENRIDLIVTQDPFITGLIGWLLKRKYDIPLSIQIAADMIENEYFIKESIFNLFLNKLAKLLIQRADTIRVNTSKEKEKLKRMGVDERKVFHVPIFVDFASFLKNDNSGIDIRQKYLNGRFDKLVLTVCRLVKQKDPQTLLKAISFVKKVYPGVLFLIIGSGQETNTIKSTIKDLDIKDNAQLIEKVSYSYIPRYFAACDLFVINSLYEGSCAVILEAMAAKKPVISTPHTGAFEAIVDGKTGFIINFGDSQQLAQKIIYLLKNPDLAREMGEEGQRLALKIFNKDKILEDFLKMWWQTVNYRNKTSGTIQKKKLWLTMFLKHLGILTYAKKIRRIYLFLILRKKYIKFYIKSNIKKLENHPLTYTSELTLQCNLKCHFCYEKDLRDKEISKEMSLEQIKQVFNMLKLEDQVVNLTGGEIFIRKDIFEILEYFKERNVYSYIVTNGTLFEEGAVNNLLKYNIRGIEFSFDGPADVHNQIRNSKDAFKRLIKAIELTKDKFRIGLNCVIQERNIDSLTEVVLIAHNLKIKELNFQLEVFTTPEALENTRRILGWDSLPVSLQIKLNSGYNFPIEKLETKWKEVKKIGKRLGMDINIYPSLFNRYIKFCVQRRLRDSNLRLMCDALLNGRIDPYGNVIPCYIIRKSFGNLLESSFESIWNSQDFREFRYKMAMNNLLPICENCCNLRLI